MNDSVSVIIPVYNPGGALKKCIESLMAQTWENIEIILVNDGSTDGSDSACREFAAADGRIKYVCQENAGVSAARNRGIELACGEYICFVDSDDYVEPDYVRSMAEAMQRWDADIVIQGLKQIQSGVMMYEEKFADGAYPMSSLSDSQFDKIFFYCGPYCKIFKSAIVKDFGIRFPLGLSYGEDAVFYHTYLEHCRRIGSVSYIGYNYMVANTNALSTKLLPPDKFWQNQSSRRGAYLRLKELYGLEPRLSEFECMCKLTGVKGMLNSIFKSGADDAATRRYLDMMKADKQFRLMDLKPSRLSDKYLLCLVKANNVMSRRLLKAILK